VIGPLVALAPNWDYQLLPEGFDDGAYDDILERIRARRALDLLGGSPDLGGEEGLRFRIGPPYGAQLDARARRERALEEVEQWRAAQRRLAEELRRQEEFVRQREIAYSKIRRDPVPSGDLFTCPNCGRGGQEILLPPPGYGNGGFKMCGGRFLYECSGCGERIGMQSKRLMAECDELRPLIVRYGWHPLIAPRSLPPRVWPMVDTYVR